MRPRLGAAAALVAIALAGAMTNAQSRANPTVPELLAASGKYLAEYERQFSAVVSEERYEQKANVRGSGTQGRRLLRSDMLVINGGPAGWISFRDVLEVDGKPVNDHKDRLGKLITELEPDTIEQAMRLAEESARYNLGNVWRTINVPNTALVFLRRENQSRSKFSFGGMKTVLGARVAQLEFKEQAKPRIIGSKDDAAAEGKFWIDPATGRVVQTEMTLKSLGRYGPDPGPIRRSTEDRHVDAGHDGRGIRHRPDVPYDLHHAEPGDRPR